MKSVAILQNDANQGPGYLLEFLANHDVPFHLIKACEGDSIPSVARDFSGLVVLGSTHSVNERLHWINQESALLAYALRANIPILGHCFGGQLLAKALGATVHANTQPHIGWNAVYPIQQMLGWFDKYQRFEAFHWHYESFAIPECAQRVLFGSHSLNVGFASGKHLGLQCHLEVTEDIIRSWCQQGWEEVKRHESTLSVQQVDDILRLMPSRLPALRRVAQHVYSHWIKGLKRPRVHALWHRSSSSEVYFNRDYSRVNR